MKNQFKEKKGITLIALVITIIVLLILAGVTIATLTGDNGLLQKAGEAKNASEKADEKEKIQVEVAGSYGLDGKIDKNLLNKNLSHIEGLIYNDESFDLNDENKRINKLPAIIQLNEYFYQIKNDGTVTSIKKPYALNTITKDNYGDYIDLGQSVVGTESTSDDWKILYNDKNGHIYAILADYLPNSNSVVTASGLNVVGETTYNVNSTISSRDLIDKFNNIAWQGLIPNELRDECKVTGATTPEIIMNSYNEKHETNLECTNRVFLRTNPNDNSSSIDMLYIPHYGEYDNCQGYWLASIFPGYDQYVWFIKYNGGLDDWQYFRPCFGVCPVVSLQSSIKATKTTSEEGTIWTVIQ